MPRIYTAGSNPIDFCQRHMPTEAAAVRRFSDDGPGPDGRGNCFGYDAEHPDYDGEDYCCHSCKRPLTDVDN
jgi:hypothetical protein